MQYGCTACQTYEALGIAESCPDHRAEENYDDSVEMDRREVDLWTEAHESDFLNAPSEGR